MNFCWVDFECPELVGTPCIEHRQQLKPEGVGGTAGGRLQLRLLVQEASDDAQKRSSAHAVKLKLNEESNTQSRKNQFRNMPPY